MNDKWEILHGDALKLLGGFAPGTFDAVITDPPYASGGRTQAEKNKSTTSKYSSMGDHAPPPFEIKFSLNCESETRSRKRSIM